ncbi:MAG: hypothetical protein U1E35_06650 [Rhodospirillales bacterium]
MTSKFHPGLRRVKLNLMTHQKAATSPRMPGSSPVALDFDRCLKLGSGGTLGFSEGWDLKLGIIVIQSCLLEVAMGMR